MPTLVILALAMGLGLLSTRLMKKLQLPNVTGYLIAGILVGPYVLGRTPFGVSFTDLPGFSVITDVALGFIALTIGTSFKLSTIKQTGKKIMIITLFEGLMALVVTLLALLTVYLISPQTIPLPVVITLGAIATATAPAATLMVVRQYNARGPLVSTLLPVVALDDAVALMSFAICFTISRVLATGAPMNVIEILVKPLIEIVGSLLIGALFGLIGAVGAHFFRSRANRLSILVALVFLGVGVSQINFWGESHFSSLLLCMMMGATFTNLRVDGDRILEGIDRWTPPLFMLFFVISGASLELDVFVTGLPIIIIASVYIVFRCVGKFFGAFLGGQITNAEPSVKKYLGFALFPQAGVAIGMATQANQNFTHVIGGAFGTLTYGQLILAIALIATLIYEIFGPVITKIALEKAGEIPHEEKTTPAKAS